MITGRWGKPSAVVLDIVTEPDGEVRGIVNPGRQDAAIRQWRFDSSTGAIQLEGDHVAADGTTIPFRIEGQLETIVIREAVTSDIPALADLHVATWNATYRTSRGPTVATRTRQWNEVFEKESRSDFVLFAEIGNPTIGFFDHMGGERLPDERGQFAGAFAWRDLQTLTG